MNIPGLLIEYIITGALAFIWIIILLSNYPQSHGFLEENSGTVTLLAIPCAYIIGMLIDKLAFNLVRKYKERIKMKEIKADYAQKLYHGATKEELIALVETRSLTDKMTIDLLMDGKKELADELKWRSSRDRIARGFIINAFLIGISLTYTLCCGEVCNWMGCVVGLAVSLFATYWVGQLWTNFEKLSFRFQVLAYLKVFKNRTQYHA